MDKFQGGVVVVPAYALMQRSNDVASPFEQESNFWWLCGIEMPNWWLIIDVSRNKSWLVSPSTTSIVASSTQASETAQLVSGVDDVLSQDTGMQQLRELSKKHSIVRTPGDQPYSQYLDFSLNPAPKRMYDVLNRIFNTVQDCRRELSQLRAIKQPEEISRIKRGLGLVIDSFDHVRPEIGSMKYEYEVEASFAYRLRRHGANTRAYDPVVASGPRACHLQYVANSEKLKKRETMIIDVGARVDGYATGLTRTISYGEPTLRQVAIHKALIEARNRIIDSIEPHLPVDQYQREVDVVMKEMLLQLGLLTGHDDEAAYRKYFPHAISHGVGVDVHDNLGASHFFQPGMVIAVEPGVYIEAEGIGMRLQDVVLINESGHVNLSKRLSTDL